MGLNDWKLSTVHLERSRAERLLRIEMSVKSYGAVLNIRFRKVNS